MRINRAFVSALHFKFAVCPDPSYSDVALMIGKEVPVGKDAQRTRVLAVKELLVLVRE